MVTVTGANGHIGANLVRELLRRGRKVRVMIHEHDESLADLDVERVRGDVSDPRSLRQAFQGTEVLYHLAALISIMGDRGGLIRATNVGGVRNVMSAALGCGVRRVVHCSSVHAFVQEPLDEPLDETRAKVTSPRYPAYDRSKAAGEAEVRAAIKQGLDAVIVNPTGIIGPWDFAPSRMGRVLLRLYDRSFPCLIGGGFNWVDVRDAVEGAIAAEEKGRTGENYLLSGHWHSARDIAETARTVTGVRPPVLTCPIWLASLAAPFATIYGRAVGREPLFTTEALHALGANRRVIHDKASRELGYEPRPIRESVRATYEWFAEAGVIPPCSFHRSVA